MQVGRPAAPRGECKNPASHAIGPGLSSPGSQCLAAAAESGAAGRGEGSTDPASRDRAQPLSRITPGERAILSAG